MASGMRLTNSGELFAALTTMSKVLANGTDDAVRAFAEEVMAESIKRTPKDTGGIEQAHRCYVDTFGQFHKAGVVIVEQCISESGIDYALLMHEGLAGKQYVLGPGSVAKNTGTPHYGQGVGWKFLERAFESVYRKYLNRVNRVREDVARVWN